ncbi:MAG: tagaturonate epimerase family protein, partial [Spirochaetaceae bacterium]|nr:tagaturonate epimerase family protein [Spirochaetaceae bacterium]
MLLYFYFSLVKYNVTAYNRNCQCLYLVNYKEIIMILEKFSIGTGDRFGKEATAQLSAVRKAHDLGKKIAIIWNKSYREHVTIHTDPSSVRAIVDKTIKETGWDGSYYVDADHIGLKTVDLFLDS